MEKVSVRDRTTGIIYTIELNDQYPVSMYNHSTDQFEEFTDFDIEKWLKLINKKDGPELVMPQNVPEVPINRVYKVLEVERITGVPRQTIKYYREKKILPTKSIKAGSIVHHVYNQDDIDKLKWITRLTRMGLKLKNAVFLYDHHREKLTAHLFQILDHIATTTPNY
jgi:hypothetical protein